MSLEQDYSIDGGHRLKQIAGMLRPHQIKGARKIRIGRHFDGGYIMINDFAGVEAAYSFGINDDVSWDLEIAQKGINVFQYDHTIDGLPCEHPLFRWKKIGVTGKQNKSPDMDTIERIIDSNSHRGCKNLILKCDIECAEWDALAHAPHNIIRQFSQIVLELHDLHHVRDASRADDMRRALGNLYASHRAVHVHANNYGGMGIVGGYPIPCVLEVTFARLDMGEFVVSDESFPSPLDMPCNKDAADIYLGRFDFS